MLPFSDNAPADVIRGSLAPFQRGQRGDLPEDWLNFHDETEVLRRAHETPFIFIDQGTRGLQIQGGVDVHWYLDTRQVRDEMQRRKLPLWRVRFADEMDLDIFFDRFVRDLERDPVTGRYGRWLNSLGRWDWWDLGGRFDGFIIGDPKRAEGRSVAQISSGANAGKAILANLEDALGDALGQPAFPAFDVLSNRNVERVATLLADARAGRENAWPGALVLPPGVVEDRLRWLDTWPQRGPTEAFAWLGLQPEASREAVVSAAYARFEDHWAAGVAFHH